jgi:tetraacyldisaccharide 4'-kinase
MAITSWKKQFLFPLSWVAAGLYGFGVHFRLWLYRSRVRTIRRLPLKVISIGNLTAGGTGKTPHTALIAGHLHRKGLKTAVLSRGYGGTKMKEGAVISDEQSLVGTVEEGGEEPYWLAQKCPGVPVVVGRDRYQSGLACVQKWRTQWAVLDDGFQHIGLARDVNILLISASRPFTVERLLPLGMLREPLAEMKRADMVLISHAERLDPAGRMEMGAQIQARCPSMPVYFSEHRPSSLWRYPDKKRLPLSELAGRPLLAFCGLAEPESFLFSLKQLRTDPVRLVEFPDHYYYREKDKRDLETLSRSLKVRQLITTEKDALKLGHWEVADLQVLVLGIDVEVRDSGFWERIDLEMGCEAEGERHEA